jgi:hypothetical protein
MPRPSVIPGIKARLEEFLDKAKDMIEVNVLEDPLYHPADNRLG